MHQEEIEELKKINDYTYRLVLKRFHKIQNYEMFYIPSVVSSISWSEYFPGTVKYSFNQDQSILIIEYEFRLLTDDQQVDNKQKMMPTKFEEKVTQEIQQSANENMESWEQKMKEMCEIVHKELQKILSECSIGVVQSVAGDKLIERIDEKINAYLQEQNNSHKKIPQITN